MKKIIFFLILATGMVTGFSQSVLRPEHNIKATSLTLPTTGTISIGEHTISRYSASYLGLNTGLNIRGALFDINGSSKLQGKDTSNTNSSIATRYWTNQNYVNYSTSTIPLSYDTVTFSINKQAERGYAWGLNAYTFNNSTTFLNTLYVRAVQTGTFKMHIGTINGTKISVKYTKLLYAATTGLITYPLDSLQLPYLPQGVNYYVFLENISGSTRGPVGYESITSLPSKYFGLSDSVYVSGVYDVSAWIKVTNYSFNSGTNADLTALTNHVNAYLPAVSFNLTTELAKDECWIPAGNYTISSPITITTGKRIHGIPGKTILDASVSGCNIFNIASKTDVLIDGLVLKGSGSAIDYSSTAVLSDTTKIKADTLRGTQIGIKITSSDRVTIRNCEIYYMTHSGIYTYYVGNSWVYGVNIDGNFIHDNYCGVRLDTRSEYSRVMNNAINNNQMGVKCTSGNMLFTGNSITKNVVGFVLGPGDNNSHGSMSACQMNHCGLYGLFIYATDNGFTFTGTQHWSAPVLISSSKGSVFTGCEFGVEPTFINGGGNAIVGSTFNSGQIITTSGTTHLNLKGNVYFDGSSSSAINN